MEQKVKTINAPVSTREDAILHYVRAIEFVHGITAAKEQRALAEMIRLYLSLQKDVLKEDLVNKLLFSHESNVMIMAASKFSRQELSLFLSKLKKKQLIVDGMLRKGILPIINGNTLSLALNFIIK
jgi:hypothetical protein